MRKLLLVLCLLTAAVSSAARAAEANDDVSAENLRRHVEVLADKALLGRRGGTPFERRAADYIARTLQEAGVPAPGSGRFQEFPLSNKPDSPTSVNVFGWIAPAEVTEREGVIVLGAHLDHMGPSDNGGYHPGADDNASGVAVLLEVARLLHARSAELKRPVLVTFFGAEELGLIGSRQFVERGPIDRLRIVAMVNVDMIGRPLADQKRLTLVKRLVGLDSDKGLGIVGTKGRPYFAQVVQSACAKTGLQPLGTQPVLSPILETLARNRSDHAPFERVGIPTLMFGSGESDDYHRPSDTADKVRFDLMVPRTATVLETVRTLARAKRDELPVRLNAVPPELPLERRVTLKSGQLETLVVDNAKSPNLLSGLQTLTHSQAADFDAFDPDGAGASAGLNFEHIISGHRSRSNRFTPRYGRYSLYPDKSANTGTLVRYREDSPWDVSSSFTYRLNGPHYVDFNFRCTPHNRARFGQRGYAIFFFANYMNDVADPSIQFRGVQSEGEEEAWISADAPPGHPDWIQGGTYRHRDADPLEYDDDVEFRLNSWSYEYPRYTQPFYYGRAANDMVFMLMFDRSHTPEDEIRFSLFKFKLPQNPRPAWDFQYVIHRVVEHRKYGFQGRLVWKKWVSREDCLQEYNSWRDSLE